MAKYHKKGTKLAISQFATFTKLQSLKKFHSRHFSIFSVEILNIASQLNLAANYWQLASMGSFFNIRLCTISRKISLRYILSHFEHPLIEKQRRSHQMSEIGTNFWSWLRGTFNKHFITPWSKQLCHLDLVVLLAL